MSYKENQITIIYDTMWQSTRKMAESISDGIQKEDKAVTVKLFNASQIDKNDILTEIFQSKAILVGSPTINNGYSYAIAGILEMARGIKYKGKKAAAFGSYGWNGDAPKMITAHLQEAGFEIVNDGIKKQWVPDVKDPRNPDNLIELENDIVDAIDSTLRGLKYHDYSDINLAIERYNQYADAFKLKRFKGLDIDFDITLRMLNLAKEDRLKRLDATKSERETERRKKAAEKHIEVINRTHSNLHLWLSDVDHDLKPTYSELQLYCDHLGYDLVRLKDSETLITQRGAEVSLDHAKRILELYRRSRMSILGKHIGSFRIEYVGKLKESTQDLESDKNTILTIGCHKINVGQAVKAMGV